ncbi:MAG TPA: LURP-one-related family protein [Chloroflexota bacterium]|nr:LURP-one-related family protein [Chloroflexota bacterium]
MESVNVPPATLERYEVRHSLFSLADTYTITDRQGDAVFEAASIPESAGRRFALRTTENLPVAEVRRRVLAPRPSYEISSNGAVLLELREDLYSLSERRLSANDPSGAYELRGDWPNQKMVVSRQGQCMAEITQAPMSEHYAVEVAPEADLPAMLCLVIALDELSHTGAP